MNLKERIDQIIDSTQAAKDYAEEAIGSGTDYTNEKLRQARASAGRTLQHVGAASAARSEAVESQLPDRLNGPADAYRHMLWSADLTRRFGTALATYVLRDHEERNRRDGQTPAQQAMDEHNNGIGITIGKRAESWEEVKAEAQRIMDDSPRDGSGGGSSAVWRPQSEWRKNPLDEKRNEIPTEQTNWPDTDWLKGRVKEPYDYPYGDYQRPVDLLEVPTASWSQSDVEAVMASAAYRNDAHPQSAMAREKVTAWFSYVYGDDPVKRDATGRMIEPTMKRMPGAGAVQVRAYTCEGDERVRAHTRGRPS